MARDIHAARKLLATNVRRLRKAKEFTQEELADRVGVRLSWISEVETAKTNSTIDNIQRLAWALGVEVLDLLKAE
jgi:transcriptional regulator with XRE-family HTH domain